MVIGLVGGAFTSQGRAAHKGVNGNIFRRPVEQQQPNVQYYFYLLPFSDSSSDFHNENSLRL